MGIVTVRIITVFIVTALLSLPLKTYAEDGNSKSYESKAMNAFLLYCLPALTAGDSVQRVAEMQKLPELRPEAEAAFLRGKPGKVYGLPEVGEGIVLAAPDIPICMIMIQKLDPDELEKNIDYWFDPAHTPFKEEENTTSSDGEITRKYVSNDNGGAIDIIINIRAHPIMGGMQALMTAGVQPNKK